MDIISVIFLTPFMFVLNAISFSTESEIDPNRFKSLGGGITMVEKGVLGLESLVTPTGLGKSLGR